MRLKLETVKIINKTLICPSVLVSCILNLLVILVLMLRRRKLVPTDVFIIALATTDIMFSLSIHPMLIATSFGADTYTIFTITGQKPNCQKLYKFEDREGQTLNFGV